MRPTLDVRTEIYTDNTARNWLTIRGCLLSPNDLGGMEVVFASEQHQVEFCLLFGNYVSNAVNPG